MRFTFFILVFLLPLSSQAALNGYLFNDFSGATDGQFATPTLISNSFKGRLPGTVQMRHGVTDADANGTFSGNHPQMIFTNAAYRELDGFVTVNGTNYAGTSGLGLRVTMISTTNVVWTIPSASSNACLGFYFRLNNPSDENTGQKDLVFFLQDGVGGAEFFCTHADAAPDFFSHQASGPTLFGSDVNFDADKWYWVTLKVTAPSAAYLVRFYDPDDNYSLVGESTHTANSSATSTKLYFGLYKYSASGGASAITLDYSNFIMANTNEFPLIPSVATKWVSTTGTATWTAAASDTALSGTSCASIATMNANAAAGDIVYFRGGNYTNQINLTASGTADARIALRGYNGETVVFSNITDYAFELVDNDYVTIDGLDSVGCDTFLLFNGSSSCIITNVNWSSCRVQADGTWVNAIRLMGSSFNNRFIDSTFKECGWAYMGDDQSRVAAIGTDNSTTDLSGTNLFLRCDFGRGGHDTVTVFSSNNRFQDCHFYNDVWYPTGSPLYGNRNLMFHGVGSGASGQNIVDGCTFFRAAPPPDAVGVSSLSVRTWGNIIRRSVFVDGADAGINLNRDSNADSWTPEGIVAFNHIFHNTIVYNGTNTGNTDNDQTAGITLTDFSDGTPAMATNLFKNNILWDNVDDRGFGFEGVVSNANGHVFLGNRNETTDPLFVDWSVADLDPDNATAHDFHLQGTSSSIDAGVWLTTITSGTGSGTSFVVADSRYFSDGDGIYAGDTIQLQGQSTARTITDVNYTTHTITVSSSVSWTSADGVALPYNGSAPDQGAFEGVGASGQPRGRVASPSARFNR